MPDSQASVYEQAPEPTREVPASELMDLWRRVTSTIPADLYTSTRQDLVNDALKQIRPWTVTQLYTYLSRPDIWTHPSFTKAVIDEVGARIVRRDLTPRTD